MAAGKNIDEAQREIQQVVEGVLAAKAVRQVSSKLGVEMPICEQVFRILHEGLKPSEAVANLMSRAIGPEA